MNEEGRKKRERREGERERVGVCVWGGGGGGKKKSEGMILKLPIKKIINMLERVFPPRTL